MLKEGEGHRKWYKLEGRSEQGKVRDLECVDKLTAKAKRDEARLGSGELDKMKILLTLRNPWKLSKSDWNGGLNEITKKLCCESKIDCLPAALSDRLPAEKWIFYLSDRYQSFASLKKIIKAVYRIFSITMSKLQKTYERTHH